MKLEQLALVRSGLVLGRKQAKGTQAYRYPLLNLRSIHPDGYVDIGLCESFEAEELLNPEYLTHIGDVVVRLTAPYTAVLITPELEGYVIPSSFIVVRTNRELLLPEYLIWLLNSQISKKQIYEGASTNSLGGIKPRFFAEVDIDVISLKDQTILAELWKLSQIEKRLLCDLAKENERYYAYSLDMIYKKLKRGN